MQEIFYKKVGRRYVPVSVYDSDLSYAMPKGSHLTVVSDEFNTTYFNVAPDNVNLLAAAKLMEGDMLKAARQAATIQPGGIGKPVQLTPKQREAWEAWVKTMPDSERYHAHYNSLMTIIQTAIKVLEDKVKNA